MLRNESLGRMVMLLCFGTAFLSLAVHWRITTAEQPALRRGSTQPNSEGNRPKRVYNNISQVGLGEIALGASVPSGSDVQKANTQNSPGFKFYTKSETISKNVARATDLRKKTQLVAQGQYNRTADNRPKSLWSQILAQQKNSSNVVASTTRQVVVDLSDRRTYVYAGDEVIASYPTAIGKKGWETPIGSFQVMHMQHHPIWRHPITGKVFEAGTDSPLGDRWIGFWSDGRNEIGFHGTPDIDLVGTAVSHGCLRMRNPDVRLLYEQVSLGTPVIVRD